MKTRPAVPYLLPDPEAVEPQEWTDADGGAISDRLEHWDPATTIALSRVVTVNLDSVRERCGLSSDAALAVTTTAYSSRTRLRIVGDPVELGTMDGWARAPVAIEVPGSRAGGRLDLVTRLVLRSPGTVSGPISPRRPGAILWEDKVSLAVEGGAARFPVTALDFSTDPGTPDGAAWKLEWSHDDLETPVLGGLRLLVNSGDDALIAAVRSGASDPRSFVIRSVVRYDVARALVHGALFNEEFVRAPERWPEESVGRMLHDLISLCWPGVPVPVLVERLRHDPGRLDAELQARLGVLDERLGGLG